MTIKNLISIYMYNDFCINIFDNKTGQKENINDDINLIKNEEAHLLNKEITYFDVKEQKGRKLIEILISKNEVN
ncbi:MULTISPECIES: hypothetical protein [Spiroplasma]|uniref:hypothetical protein n=1 Tax=Spiroplasma TaxID=2132 RepID=UPI0018DC83FA|nr:MULTISPECIES: hypothetical protein [Spiroplasma]MBH8623478.1 hypothetical protein [Spiroplasma sp. hyd1]UNF62656.1 hypothetical protein MNU24_04190 [Spiroplasma poulsonii]